MNSRFPAITIVLGLCLAAASCAHRATEPVAPPTPVKPAKKEAPAETPVASTAPASGLRSTGLDQLPTDPEMRATGSQATAAGSSSVIISPPAKPETPAIP